MPESKTLFGINLDPNKPVCERAHTIESLPAATQQALTEESERVDSVDELMVAIYDDSAVERVKREVSPHDPPGGPSRRRAPKDC